MAVLLAHIWTEVCSKCFKRTPQGIQDDNDRNNLRYPPENDAIPVQAAQPTYSVIEGPRPAANIQELKDPVSN